jgi:cytochrome c-type biogenesis protein CcmH/NrfG/cold shock CspA family protein
MTNVEDLLSAAEKAAQATDWGRAADLLTDAPDQVRILDKRAFYLSRAKRYEESRQVLAVLRTKEPKNFLWWHMTGFQYYEEGRYADAVPWLIEAYRLNPTHIRNLYRLAQARRHQGELGRATRAGGEVLKLWHALPAEAQEREAKTMAKASYLLARLQVDRDPRGAIPLLEQAVEHDSGDHDKHYMLGKTYRRVGERQRGLEALTRAQRIKPGRAYIELELADALAHEGRTEDAARALGRGQRGTRDWQAWKAARIALRLGLTDDARQLLDVAARDRKVRRSPEYEQLKASLDAAAPTQKPSAELPPRSRGERERESNGEHDSPSTGKVHHLRPERGFGFLIDDEDGERCYFKLRNSEGLTDGQRVRFIRSDTERGPAARDVQPAP